MKYTDSKFDHFYGGKDYRDGWARTFAKCKKCSDAGWVSEHIESADRAAWQRCSCNPETPA